jgi:hypothetical protein
MTPLLDRVRGELQRRAAPPSSVEVIAWFLTLPELREARDALRAAVRGEPLDRQLLARLERRAVLRRRIGWLPGGPNERHDRLEHRAWWEPKYDWCLDGIGGCSCLPRTLDTTRRLATRRGLEFHARRHHDRYLRETQPSVFDPNYRPEPDRLPQGQPQPVRLGALIPFRKREPHTEPLVLNERADEPGALDPALEARAPLETLEQLAERLHVPLYPQPPDGSYP